MDIAPFHAALAEGDTASAHWITTSDGVRLRIAVWPKGENGTVLLFPGRTEYVEKYGRAAQDFAQRGFATLAIDWRGQGLADRLIKDTALGHIDRFLDYQKDVAAALAAAQALDLPKPYYLVAHSMGGAIGLRALLDGLDVKAVAFSAPMWGILMSPVMRPVAWGLSFCARKAGLGHLRTLGTKRETYVKAEPFAGNMLTSDQDMFDYMARQIRGAPDLALGGPTFAWLNEALKETRTILAAPAPNLPCYTALGTGERIVDPTSVHAKMGSWPNGELTLVDGAEHEIMMETPPRRAAFFDGAAALFLANR